MLPTCPSIHTYPVRPVTCPPRQSPHVRPLILDLRATILLGPDPSRSRYDATVSRFATVIDLHDTLVYCAPKAHYCKFTKLTQPVSEVTVRVDAPSYLLSKNAGAAIHRELSGDDGLTGGVSNWGHAGDPTHQVPSPFAARCYCSLLVYRHVPVHTRLPRPQRETIPLST